MQEHVSKHCLDFEMNTLFMFFTVEKKYAHILQSLDCVQTYMLHVEHDDAKNKIIIAKKVKFYRSL